MRAQTSADDIESMMERATEGRGHFKKAKDSMVTGVTNSEEVHGIAVIRAKYDKKSAIFRIAFDPVSYTHLDVYKRQPLHDLKRRASGGQAAGRRAGEVP